MAWITFQLPEFLGKLNVAQEGEQGFNTNNKRKWPSI